MSGCQFLTLLTLHCNLVLHWAIQASSRAFFSILNMMASFNLDDCGAERNLANFSLSCCRVVGHLLASASHASTTACEDQRQHGQIA